jgi:hypothetical protein
MASGRMVSSRVATDARLAALSCPAARLLYITMITQADAKGRLRGEPAYIRQVALQNERVTDAQVARWLSEMVSQKLISWYEVDGSRYIELVGWREHKSLCQQRLDRATHSDYPDPGQPVVTGGNQRLAEGEGEGEGEVEGEGEPERMKQQRPFKRRRKSKKGELRILPGGAR